MVAQEYSKGENLLQKFNDPMVCGRTRVSYLDDIAKLIPTYVAHKVTIIVGNNSCVPAVVHMIFFKICICELVPQSDL